MRVIARKTLATFWSQHADAEGPLRAWFAEATKATWLTTADIKERYAKASVIDGERIVFDIGGNKYRLVTKVWFNGRTIWVKFIGTHSEYDKIDVTKL